MIFGSKNDPFSNVFVFIDKLPSLNSPTSAFETGKPDSLEMILPPRFEVTICDK